MAVQPVHRVILAVDVANSTKRTNPELAQVRTNLYTIFKSARRAARIPPAGLDQLIDRGDGFLALFHPMDVIPMTALLSRLIPEVAERLSGLPAEHSFRLRAALHAGGVHYDRQGCFGEEINVACRLLDAPAVKRKLQQEVESPLVVAVSDSIYQSVVRQGYEGIDATTFERIHNVQVGLRRVPAWVHVPRL